ncbi:Protein of unknown function [Marinobacter segnicrescens]|uniref:Lysozyme inhibitor LprI-like N-terminal domain-containing protein n=1 Tax=Marinobacter segnicrescens TaxID=430453 RepID=A0A1I0IDK5_9GAMM|nr:lysozyme inhibitor LprI family protein [Marinobacter segnicrescens]SET94019.1 Protein of unknown function [Marinobacter segnicrescens]
MITLSRVIRPFAFLSITLTSVACQAIDNPDAPNYLDAFQSEASAYEQAIFEESQTTSDSMEAYREYIAFLEDELVKASSALAEELSASEKDVFEKSQSAWEAYQEAEKVFVSRVWTPQNFGSSSPFSRLAFYADVLRSRVELLQKYRLQF